MASCFRLLCLLLLISVIHVHCKKQEKTDENVFQCSYTNSTYANYLADCQQLIFREINKDTTHPDYHNPYFDQAKIEDLLNGIQAIKDLNTPESDSVFSKHDIHAFPDTGLNQIHLELDTSYTYAQNLMSSKPSGEPRFDSLMQEFNFQILYVNNPYLEITLHSPERYNIIAVASLFESFPFVTGTDVNHFSGFPDEIEVKSASGLKTFDFSHGWGDCLAGCIYRKHWIFEVDENCNARFVESFMD